MKQNYFATAAHFWSNAMTWWNENTPLCKLKNKTISKYIYVVFEILESQPVSVALDVVTMQLTFTGQCFEIWSRDGTTGHYCGQSCRDTGTVALK